MYSALSRKYSCIRPPIYPDLLRGTELLEFGLVPERAQSAYPTDMPHSRALQAGRLGALISQACFRERALGHGSTTRLLKKAMMSYTS